MMTYETLLVAEEAEQGDVDALELLNENTKATLDQALRLATYRSTEERRAIESAVVAARECSRRRHAGMAPAARLLSLRVETVRIKAAISRIISHRRTLANQVTETSSASSSIQSSLSEDPHEPQGVVDQHT